ncbi:4-hydroxy-tetrahydrodipicolinate synthase [Anseongella ginsenosidimutans]|uniref:4-hydroxy-tetrahydrodipicolinate synthase n=1 Tax=Anseongella ginsenosidimutans TaxID=496056 RepID=A0A4R3KZ05_9SPHI|nr:dihydrodipicolinate synthase family protein [Anseongella ginsenosidimutans]QEC51056.1 dihydrodipicolinate synthase family protein [Anseongella ginsenosidimutans]TCS90286.1 4-hydroxy-tetrahydrodipicolinate synthase [Anseongella ginsenosidimutans]
MAKQRGFIPVMLTPFEENGRIDYAGLARLTEYYLQCGALGLFANCLSGEMYDLEEEERRKILKQVLQTAGGRVPVVATGTFSASPGEQAACIRQVHDAGAAATIIITGVVATAEEPDQVLDARIFDLFRRTEGIPLGFYECPEPYKRILQAEQLKPFLETGRVIYYKDTCLDLSLVKKKLKAAEGRDFGLYDAYAVHAVESLRAGAAGLSCIQGNYFPELITWLCDNFNDKAQQPEVEKVQQFLTRNMELMHSGYPATAKYFLQKRGILKNAVTRKKTVALTVMQKAHIDRLFETYRALAEETGILIPSGE